MFKKSDGSWSQYPDQKQALTLKSAFYHINDKCPQCGNDVKAVRTGLCSSCSRVATVDLYNHFYHGHALNYDKYLPEIAVEIMFWVGEFSKNRHEFKVLTTLKKNGCFGVVRKVTPRNEAVKRGDKWYTPDDPCHRCNTRSMRYVATGACQGCKGAKASDSAAKACIDALGADFVISRKDAKATGLKVYRTGFYCKRGHTGWRWTSTGNCINCAG